jgi:hypothetical protein
MNNATTSISWERERKHDYAQEVSPGPPERKDEEDGEDNAGDLARVGVEPARDERRADQARTEVARREREPGYAAGHDRRAALIRCSKAIICQLSSEESRRLGMGKKTLTIELDGVNVCACEDAHERVAHLFT